MSRNMQVDSSDPNPLPLYFIHSEFNRRLISDVQFEFVNISSAGIKLGPQAITGSSTAHNRS